MNQNSSSKLSIKNFSKQISDSFNPQIHLSQKAFSQKRLLELDISGEIQNASQMSDSQSIQMTPIKKISNHKTFKQFKSQISIKASSFKQISLQKFFFTRHVMKSFAHKFLLKSQVQPRKNKNEELLKEQYIQDQNYNAILKQNNTNNNQKLPIIKLQSRFLILWQLLRILQYLLLMWWMPFKISYNQTQDMYFFEQFVLILMILDIFIVLNKEIIDQGQVIEKRVYIFYNYLKSESFLDLVYVTSYVLTIYQFLAFPVLEIVEVMIFFINLFKFQQIINYYKETAQSVNEFMNLMELIITVLILAHFMACIWFHVGILSKVEYEQSWITVKGLEQESQFIQYFYSFYWATTTMVTVGYGDISPENIYEVICATILMFFSSGVFAFSINSIGMILTNINQNQSNYKRSLLLINSYMIQNHVSTDLQSKVRNYIKFYCDSNIQNNQQEVNNVVNQLSSNLRSELLYDVQSKALNQSPFFTKYFSESAKKLIAQNLEQINFTPQEQIYQQGFLDDCAIYIIQKGEVLIVDQTSGKQLQKLKQGDIFGEIEFLTGQERHSSSYSLSFCQIFKINRNKFIQVIHNESQDIQQFHQLKDQLLMKVGCYQQCQVCQEDHIIWDCNKLFYKPNIEAILKKDLFHSNQNRKFFKRSQNRNIFNLSNQDFVQQSCKEYQQKNDLIQDYESSKDYNEAGLESESVATQTQQQLQSNSQINKQSRMSINNQHSEESILKIPQQVIKNYDDNLKRKSHNVINDDTIKGQVKTTTQYQKKSSMIPFNKTNRQSVVRQVSQLNVPEQTHKILLEYLDNQSDNYFQEIVIDQQKHYNNYFPHNNFQQVLLDLEKFQKKQQKVQTIMVPSNYKFFKTAKIVMSKRNRAKQNIQIDI